MKISFTGSVCGLNELFGGLIRLEIKKKIKNKIQIKTVTK
jgi:hypothetical protein